MTIKIKKYGAHRVLAGSAISPQVLQFLERLRVDAVMTDIPYNVSQKSNGLRSLSYGDWDHGGTGVVDTIKLLEATTAPTWLAFCASQQLSLLQVFMAEQGRSVRTGVWIKSNPSPMNGKHIPLSGVEVAAMSSELEPSLAVYAKSPRAWWGGHCESLVWRGSAPRGQWRLHTTQKPLDLVIAWLDLICPEGGTVLDPFLGSGTTLLAAEATGRRCVGVEVEGPCLAMVETRWARREDEIKRARKALEKRRAG